MKRVFLFSFAVAVACLNGACERHRADELEVESASEHAKAAHEPETHNTAIPKAQTQDVPGGVPKAEEAAKQPPQPTATPKAERKF